MQIKEILNYLIKFNKEQLNEMTIRYGNKKTNTYTVNEAISKILNDKYTQVNTSCKLKINIKEVDKISIKEYPITIVKGEPDVSGKEGHGIIHILQSHEKDFKIGRNLIDKAINKTAEEEISKSGNKNAVIYFKGFKFVFTEDKEQAILITFYKTNGR